MQNINVTSVNLNDGSIEIYAELNYSLAVCPKRGKISNQPIVFIATKQLW